MFQVRGSAYVLESTQLSEHKALLCLFSAEKGLVKGVYRLGRLESRAALGQLSRVRFELRCKDHQELGQLVLFELDRPCWLLRQPGYLALCLVQHWSWLLAHTLPAHQEEPLVWRLLEHVLPAIPGEERGMVAAQVYFETWLLHSLGLLPRLATSDFCRQQGEACLLAGLSLPPIEASPCPGERELFPALFKLRIEDFLPLALECSSLSWSTELLHALNRHLLQRALPTWDALRSAYQLRGLP
jgi:recombinational DNA repair protein (RecF pathway)